MYTFFGPLCIYIYNKVNIYIYYAALFTDVSGLRNCPIDCTEMLVNKYEPTLRKIPGQRRPQSHCGGDEISWNSIQVGRLVTRLRCFVN